MPLGRLLDASSSPQRPNNCQLIETTQLTTYHMQQLHHARRKTQREADLLMWRCHQLPPQFLGTGLPKSGRKPAQNSTPKNYGDSNPGRVSTMCVHGPSDCHARPNGKRRRSRRLWGHYAQRTSFLAVIPSLQSKIFGLQWISPAIA
jgi:hypothetical protein